MQSESSELTDFLERLEAWLEDSGLPRIPARVLAYLMVCDPPAQSSEELARAVRASGGSISTATQLLVRTTLVQRSGRPGDRRSYFEVAPNAWQFLLDRQLTQLSSLRELTTRGLAALATEPPARASRVADLDELARFLLAEYAGLRERWHARAASPAAPPATSAQPASAPATSTHPATSEPEDAP